VELTQTRELIGMVELRREATRADIGYVFARPFWGKGLAYEAVNLPVQWALAQPKLFRVWAVTDVQNQRSARLLERLGMQREGILRRWLVHPNVGEQPRDCVCYSIVKT
jgi:RimJ/RimL family protein N-acetyltransferase